MLNLANILDILWTSIVAYSMFQGYLLFILFPTYKQGSRQAKWLLAIASLLCAILLTEELLSHTIGYEKLPHMIMSTSPLWYLVGPIIFFYIRLYATKRIVTKKDLWHFLPAIWVLFTTLDFYSYPGEIKLYYLQMTEKGSSAPIHTINFVIFFCQSVFYIISSWSLMKSESSYEYRRKERMWILQLIIGLGVLGFLGFLSIVVLNVGVENLWWVGSTYFILFTGFLLVLFVRSLRSPKDLYLIGNPRKLNPKNTDVELNEAFLKLLKFLEDHKPYRDPEFDLQTLSKQLQYSKHHLSQTIKEFTNLNFRDFINQYRLEEAKQKLASAHSKQFTIQSIANDAGFTSLATFYRAFKKLEGRTPKSFID